MLRSGEILVFRHDHLSFAYEGLTFGTLKLDLWFLPPIYPPFRKRCVQFHDLALRFFIGMLSISCDFGEPRALDHHSQIPVVHFVWIFGRFFFETNFPQWAMWTSRFVRPDFGRHAFIDSDLDPVDRCKVVWLRGGGDEVMWIHSIFGLYIHYMYEEL